ncbi:MAG TPA: hypothetical protein VMS93_05320 [Candidatus Saccharimonadales bacterium]|nr:hypothetical protein [Candidatus Saccharimonadales bacterium]
MRPYRPVAAALGWVVVLAIAGCARNPGAPAGPSRLSLAVRWAASATAADTLVDSLTAEVLDAGGGRVAGPASLALRPDHSFSGALAVPAGSGLTVQVRAYARGDEFFRGASDPFTLHPEDSARVAVTLAPSVTLHLSQLAANSIFGDSVDLALACSGPVPLRGVQTDVTYDPALLTFGRAVAHTAALAGFDWALQADGRVRVLLYGDTRSQQVPPGQAVQLCVLRFASCSPARCGYVARAFVSLEASAAASAHGLSQPLTVSADSVRFIP